MKVFERACANCHLHGNLGKKFGPDLTGADERLSKTEIIRSIVWPNEKISKGFETVMVLDFDGVATNGFILKEDETELTLGIANGKVQVIKKDEIDIRKEMNASSMPEGLLETIAPGEFLDLVAFLSGQWIPTRRNADLSLRTHGEFVEVSRESKVLLGKGFPAELSREANLLLSGKQPQRAGFAFHSPDGGSDQPEVIIALEQPAEIRHVELENRREAEFHDRADGLAMWVSDDRQNWKKVWTSEKPIANWSFDLPEGIEAKYIKLGLTKRGIFHLNQAVFYGRPLK